MSGSTLDNVILSYPHLPTLGERSLLHQTGIGPLGTLRASSLGKPRVHWDKREVSTKESGRENDQDTIENHQKHVSTTVQ